MMTALTTAWTIVALTLGWQVGLRTRRPRSAPLVRSRRRLPSSVHRVAAPIGRWRRRLADRRGADIALERVAALADLMAVAVSAGASVGSAIDAVHRHLPRPRAVGLDELVRDVAAGSRLDVALLRWGETHPSPVDELAALLRNADRGGVAVLDALGRLAVDLRRRRRRAAEERARRLPVTMLMPLVLCILPAFGLVTVVPMIAVGVDRLSGL